MNRPGKTAVVTGAGSGLGAAISLELSRRGFRLALMDRDPDRLDFVAQQLPPGTTTHIADVSSESEIAAAAKAIGPAVHLLILNAGISISLPFHDTNPADFRRLMDVNFFGAVNCARAFLPHLTSETPSQIVAVSSCFAWLGYPGKSAYAASKAALRSWAESLRHELAPKGVGVTILYPGAIATNIVRDGISASDRARTDEDGFLRQHGLSPETVARRTCDALPRSPARILIGTQYRLLDAAARLSPALAERLVRIAASRAGF